MPRKQQIKLEWALPLNHETAPQQQQEEAAPQLPPNLPNTLKLTDDQAHQLAQWWQHWTTTTLDKLRAALSIPADPRPGRSNQQTLHNLTIHAVILSHLLGLHPATDTTLTALSHHPLIGTSVQTLRRIRAQITNTLFNDPQKEQGITPSQKPHKNTLKQLMQQHPNLKWDSRRGKRPCYIIPFKARTTIAAKLNTMLCIDSHPHINAELTTPKTSQAELRLTFTQN